MKAEKGGSTTRSESTCNTLKAANANGNFHHQPRNRLRPVAFAWLFGLRSGSLRPISIPVAASRIIRPHPADDTAMPMPSESPSAAADLQLRFLLPAAGVRGVAVRLDQAWRSIAERGPYPEAAAELLGEAAAATALFTGHAKVDGRLSIQLRGTGALRTLFAECTAAGTLRGIARLEEAAPPPRGLDELGPDPILASGAEGMDVLVISRAVDESAATGQVVPMTWTS